MSKLFYGDIGHEPSIEPREKLENTVVGHCEICGEPIYAGYEYYDLLEAMVCEDCVSSSRRYG